MDCPTCGLANPPGALRCDCGYDFVANKPSDTPGWEIKLSWGQNLAAFWSITWPALVGFLVLFSGYSPGLFQEHLFANVGAKLAIFGMQAILTRRLVRKNYRSFRVYVVREGGERTRRLSIRETASVWLRIFMPQLVYYLLWFVIYLWGRTKIPLDTLRAISEIGVWLQIFFVGPYGVDLAVRAKYPTFRLQPYGLRNK